MEKYNQNKEDIDKLNIIKSKEKELQSFNEELGVINIIDISKIIKQDKKFSSLSLSMQKESEFNIEGKNISETNIPEIQNEIQEKEEKKRNISNKKKKKKTKVETKKNGDTKLCRKEKKLKEENN
jgi:hypothetical protein